MGFWEIVGVSLTSGGVVAGVFVFLSKAFLEHQLSKALEKFKIDLEAEHQRASLKFGVLHEERKRHVLSLYKATVETRSALNAMLNPLQSAGRSLFDQLKKAADAYEELHNAGVAARIVLNDDEHGRVTKMIDAYFGVYVRAQTIVQMCRGEEAALWRQGTTEWRKLGDEMKTIDGTLETAVRNDFRRILGVA